MYPNGAGAVLPNKIPGSEWLLSARAAAGSQSTITKAAGGTRVKNVVTNIIVGVMPNATGVAATVCEWHLLDSVAGTIIDQIFFSSGSIVIPPTVISQDPIYKGALNAALTLEFVAALAGFYEIVTMGGYQIIE